MSQLWKRGGLALSIGLLVWGAFFILTPPRIPGGDFICFKDPGVNLARGEGLVERASPANHSLEGKFYGNYPPLFPTLYGIYVYLVGLSPKSDQMFDFFIAAAAAVLFRRCLTRHGMAAPRLANNSILVLTILLLPVGPFWTQRERPDYLAFVIIASSFLLLPRTRAPFSYFLVGLVTGVNVLISPYAFVSNCIALCFVLLLRDRFARSEPKKFLTHVWWLALGASLPLAGLFVILWMFDPSSLTRLTSSGLGHSTAGRAGIGYFLRLLSGDVDGFLAAFSRYDSFRYKWMLCHLLFTAVTTAVAAFILARKTTRARQWLSPAALLALAALPLCVFPYQPCYMSFTAALVLLLFWELTRHSVQVSMWIVATSLAVMAGAALPFTARDFFVAYSARASYQTMERVVQEIPRHAERPLVAAVSAPAYFVFKRDGFVVQDLAYLRRAEGIDVLAVSFNGEKIEGPRNYPEWWQAEELQLVHFPNLDSTPRLFGIPVYRRVATWETAIFRRHAAD